MVRRPGGTVIHKTRAAHTDRSGSGTDLGQAAALARGEPDQGTRWPADSRKRRRGPPRSRGGRARHRALGMPPLHCSHPDMPNAHLLRGRRQDLGPSSVAPAAPDLEPSAQTTAPTTIPSPAPMAAPRAMPTDPLRSSPNTSPIPAPRPRPNPTAFDDDGDVVATANHSFPSTVPHPAARGNDSDHTGHSMTSSARAATCSARNGPNHTASLCPTPGRTTSRCSAPTDRASAADDAAGTMSSASP